MSMATNDGERKAGRFRDAMRFPHRLRALRGPGERYIGVILRGW